MEEVLVKATFFVHSLEQDKGKENVTLLVESSTVSWTGKRSEEIFELSVTAVIIMLVFSIEAIIIVQNLTKVKRNLHI